MKKLSIICVFILVLGLMAGPAFPLSYEFDFDGDEVWDTEWTLNIGKTVRVEIWLDGFSCIPSNYIFLLFYFQYDSTKIQVNQVIPNNTDNGGPFENCEYIEEEEEEVYILLVEGSNSAIDNRILIFTIELECIDDGSDATIKAASDLGFGEGNYDDGRVLDCYFDVLYPDDANATVHQLPDIEPTTTTIIPTTTTTMPATVTTSTSSSSSSSSTTSATVGSTTTTTACPAEEIYGEYSEQTEILRYFRDNVLSQTPEGQEIIRLYYEWGSGIVKAIERDEEFKGDMKEMIDGVFGLITETE